MKKSERKERRGPRLSEAEISQRAGMERSKTYKLEVKKKKKAKQKSLRGRSEEI